MRSNSQSPLLPSAESDPESDADAVIRRYREAEAVYYEPIYQHGQSVPCQEGEWVILDPSAPDAGELGRGETEEAAWADAARRLAQVPSSREAAA